MRSAILRRVFDRLGDTVASIGIAAGSDDLARASPSPTRIRHQVSGTSAGDDLISSVIMAIGPRWAGGVADRTSTTWQAQPCTPSHRFAPSRVWTGELVETLCHCQLYRDGTITGTSARRTVLAPVSLPVSQVARSRGRAPPIAMRYLP
jgi:hypothetical protein